MKLEWKSVALVAVGSILLWGLLFQEGACFGDQRSSMQRLVDEIQDEVGKAVLRNQSLFEDIADGRESGSVSLRRPSPKWRAYIEDLEHAVRGTIGYYVKVRVRSGVDLRDLVVAASAASMANEGRLIWAPEPWEIVDADPGLPHSHELHLPEFGVFSWTVHLNLELDDSEQLISATVVKVISH